MRDGTSQDLTEGWDEQLQDWFELALNWRDERLNTGTLDGSYYQFYYACPVVDGARIVNNGCPYPNSGALSRGLEYEWSGEHQAAFEDIVGPHLDFGQWDRLVTEYRSHWPNTMSRSDGAPWFDSLAPNLETTLHELGKTKPFRVLRTLPLNVWPEGTAVTVGDVRCDGARPEIALYRSGLITERGMLEWYSHRYTDIPWTVQVCLLCEEEFWPQTLDSVDITRTGLPRYCSPCVRLMRRDVWRLGHISKKDLAPMLITLVQRFYEITGVYPYATITDTHIGELPVGERDLWAKLLFLMPRTDTAKAVFGSWQHYLNKAGMLDTAPRSGYAGYVTIAADGHVALSIGERLICDWLHARGITHEKEPNYPTHAEFNADGLLRADWLIGDCWVELAGRMNDEKYAANMRRKQELAHSCGLRHLVLLPAEVLKLDQVAAEHWAWQSASEE